jgi:F-type H+-transporting ATPase subunit a
MINWSGKRRWIALGLLLAGFFVMLRIPPVIPVIQLPGEKLPGASVFGLPLTNTLVGSFVVWVLIGLLILYVTRVRPRGGDEVPPGGFYNIFEMLYEGLYGFIGNIVGTKYMRYIFSFFMTIFLIVILSNWQALVPGVDSIGVLEPHVHLDAETGETETLSGYEATQGIAGVWTLNPACPWVSPAEAEALNAEQQAARLVNGCKTGTGQPVTSEAVAHVTEGETAATETAPTGETIAEATAVEETATTDEAHAAEGEAATTGETVAAEEHHYAPGDPSVPWVVVPFVRPPSTDLNVTLSLALIAVIMTQVLGFRANGLGYLTKFFNFKTLLTSPLGGIDVAVGLLELIGEFAKILSFSFRLLGNVFAGSVLLFVMSFLMPFLPWPFFILEFFVGALQAFVFGLLTAIFMSQATAGHHGGEEHSSEEHSELGAPAEAHA